jgi:MFS family permease
VSTAAAHPDRHAGEAGSNRWLVLVIVCLPQFMVVLDATVVNVALPSIQTDLGFSAANLQWVINAYMLVFGGFLVLGGRAGERGRSGSPRSPLRCSPRSSSSSAARRRR